MTSVILACEDPYEAARLFVEGLGWRLVFATPAEGEDRLACVALGDSEVMLGTDGEEFLPLASRDHKGAGVVIYLTVPNDGSIEEIHARHEAAGVVTEPLAERAWGPRAFNADICGYSFLFAEEPAG